MKRLLLSLVASIAALTLVSAQEKPRFNPDQTWNTIRAEYGMLVPMDSYMASSDAFLSLTYTRRFSRHWGWRTGIQYDTEMMSVEDHIGVPVAAVFRTRTYGFGESVRTAAAGAASSAVYEKTIGYGSRDVAENAIFNFLFFLFRRAEGFAGVTPGYVFGHEKVHRHIAQDQNFYDEGIQLNRRFTLTADAGFTLSIPVWRFSLDVTPAFHYLITNNFSEYHQDFDPLTDRPVGQPALKPLRWQFSLTGGMSFLF